MMLFCLFGFVTQAVIKLDTDAGCWDRLASWRTPYPQIRILTASGSSSIDKFRVCLFVCLFVFLI